MSPETLLAMTGEVIVAVRAKDIYDVRDLVRIKKITADEYEDIYSGDITGEGKTDSNDIVILKQLLLLK